MSTKDIIEELRADWKMGSGRVCIDVNPLVGATAIVKALGEINDNLCSLITAIENVETVIRSSHG